MKILNVDDKQTNLYFVEALMRGRGHEVVSARNGVDALRELENTMDEAAATGQNGFDLILSDILMPEMDGFQLCREVKMDERFQSIPFIFYTATYTSRQDEEFGLSLGASRFIVKPVEPDELSAALEEVSKSRERSHVPEPEAASAEDYLRVYNQRLVNKLERKVEQLEAASKELTALVADRDREIDRRRIAENDLRRSDEQLRLVWENSIDGMLLMDSSGIVLTANSAFAQMCGVELQDLDGGNFIDCRWRDPGEASRSYQYLSGNLSAGEHFEQSLIRPDSSEVLLDGSITPFDSAGTGLVFGLFRDVTARRREENERAVLEGQLAEARRLESVGRLAGGVAHDFNNLLTVITGYCDLLGRHLSPDKVATQMVSQIRTASKRAADLTCQLLAFSRKQKRANAPLDLNALTKESLPMLQRLVGDHVDVITNLEPALGSVMGDAGQLLQVLMNLAANARDAMPAGGTLTILTANKLPERSARPAQIDPLVSLVVSDTGTGIAEDTLPYIFDPFFTTKEGEGTGLGLFTVSGIIQRSGGSISVRRVHPEGTAFEILLPQVRTDHAPEIHEPANLELETAPARDGETILVVEDRKDVRGLVVSILRSSGYTVLEAVSGADALAVSNQHNGPIHLLLTDILMPEMNGRDLAARLKSSRPSICIILMSGDFSSASTDERLIPENCITKPFTASMLTAGIREVLDKRRSENTFTASRAQGTG